MKVAICVPHHRDVKAGFAASLGRLLVHSTKAGLQPELFFFGSSVLVQAREKVVAAGLDWGAEWLLLLDSDHTFPADTMLRLLARGKPAVGCNAMKSDGSGPVLPIGEGLEEVEHSGLGIFLISRRPFETMAEQAQKAGQKTILPLFAFERTPEGGIIGEDVFFCRKLKAAGFPIFCDHDLSREIGHIGERTFTLGGEDAHAGSVLPATGDQPRR